MPEFLPLSSEIGVEVIWDNLALQHGRPAFHPRPGDPAAVRTLRRVVVSDHYDEIFAFAPRLKAAMAREHPAE